MKSSQSVVPEFRVIFQIFFLFICSRSFNVVDDALSIKYVRCIWKCNVDFCLKLMERQLVILVNKVLSHAYGNIVLIYQRLTNRSYSYVLVIWVTKTINFCFNSWLMTTINFVKIVYRHRIYGFKDFPKLVAGKLFLKFLLNKYI